MYDQELKRKLRNILAHNNLSMNQLAKEVGVSEGTVRKLLNEETDLTPSAKVMAYLYDIDRAEADNPDAFNLNIKKFPQTMRNVSFIELFYYLRNLEADHFDLTFIGNDHVIISPNHVFSIDDLR